MNATAMDREPFGGSLFYHPDILGQLLNHSDRELEHYNLTQIQTHIGAQESFLTLSHIYLQYAISTSQQAIGRDILNIMNYVSHYYEDNDTFEWNGYNYPQELVQFIHNCIPYITTPSDENEQTILAEFLSFCKKNYSSHILTQSGQEILTNITQRNIT